MWGHETAHNRPWKRLLSGSIGTCRGHLRTVEHADQPSADRWFDLGAISCDLDLAIGIPRVPETSSPVERESVRRHPLDLEGLAERLRRCGTA